MQKNNSYKFLIIFLLWLGFIPVLFADNTITGAGATFPAPLYNKWANAYAKQTGIHLNYQAIGSGAGIKQISNNTVDFGATDKPLLLTELQQNHLLQFPMVVGGIVTIYHLPIPAKQILKLTPAVLANIYLGKITRWNDPQITAINPGVQLPDLTITVIHRADGSGTTYLFTNYLTKVNTTWQSQVGADTSVNWPTGLGGKGNEGVASYVKQINGAIGYVEYAFAKSTGQSYALLQNSAGNFVQANLASFNNAALNTNWDSSNGFYQILTNAAGAQSWPIVGASFILIRTDSKDLSTTLTVLKFFDWAYQHGQPMALALDYVPMPASVVKSIETDWALNLKDAKGQTIWN